MCAEQQAGFVRWAGLNIAATYGRPESFTPQLVRELVDIGRESSVTLVIDNVQSGQNAGAGVADELGCNRIILSNFPGCFKDTETWEKAIDQNIDLIIEAISR
jgi:zinc transport system substrate-binding protein